MPGGAIAQGHNGKNAHMVSFSEDIEPCDDARHGLSGFVPKVFYNARIDTRWLRGSDRKTIDYCESLIDELRAVGFPQAALHVKEVTMTGKKGKTTTHYVFKGVGADIAFQGDSSPRGADRIALDRPGHAKPLILKDDGALSWLAPYLGELSLGALPLALLLPSMGAPFHVVLPGTVLIYGLAYTAASYLAEKARTGSALVAARDLFTRTLMFQPRILRSLRSEILHCAASSLAAEALLCGPDDKTARPIVRLDGVRKNWALREIAGRLKTLHGVNLEVRALASPRDCALAVQETAQRAEAPGFFPRALRAVRDSVGRWGRALNPFAPREGTLDWRVADPIDPVGEGDTPRAAGPRPARVPAFFENEWENALSQEFARAADRLQDQIEATQDHEIRAAAGGFLTLFDKAAGILPGARNRIALRRCETVARLMEAVADPALTPAVQVGVKAEFLKALDEARTHLVADLEAAAQSRGDAILDALKRLRNDHV